MSGENLTLRRADLLAMKPSLRPKMIGGRERAGCPFHKSDRHRSLAIDPDTGRFHCYACGCWGYTEEAREKFKAERAASESTSQSGPKTTPLPRLWVREDVMLDELPADALARIEAWQAALPDSPAHQYLRERGIPLELARAMGAGYLPRGEAMSVNAEGKPTGWGPRIVFPHTRPDGAAVSVYGRRIDGGDTNRHYHLPGAKGAFNAQALSSGTGPLWLTEGVFDALSLMVAGIERVAAIFGLNGMRWEWLQGVQEIVLALDADAPGQEALKKLHAEAAMRGIRVSRLTPDELGGKKDANEALVAGCLQIGGVAPRPPTDPVVAELQRRVSELGDAPQAHLSGEWQAFKTLAARFVALHLPDALAAGWAADELFSLPWNRLGTGGGAVWTLAGFDGDISIRPDAITVGRDGIELVHRRGTPVTGSLPW